MHDGTADVGQIVWSLDDPMPTDFHGGFSFLRGARSAAVFQSTSYSRCRERAGRDSGAVFISGALKHTYNRGIPALSRSAFCSSLARSRMKKTAKSGEVMGLDI